MNSVLRKIWKYAKGYPNKTAAIFENETVSYSQLWEKSLSVAQYLRTQKILPGSYIAVQSCFTKQFAITCYAAWLNGCVFIPVEEKISNENLIEFCKETGCETTVTTATIPGIKNSFTFEEFSQLEDICIKDFIPSPVSNNSPACVVFTTGTTGKPKGIVWTGKSIAANCKNRRKMFNFNKDSIDLTFVPLNHSAPLWKMFAIHFWGGCCIFLNGLTRLQNIYNTIKEKHVTSLYVPPAGISVIQALAPQIFTSFSSTLKVLSVGSSAINEKQRDFLQMALPDTKLIYSYSASETGVVSYLDLNKTQKEINCTGKPSKGVKIKIYGSETGTVAIKSKMNCAGYLTPNGISKDSFKNGYFISTDSGFLDKDGFLHICGREDDIINIGGLKVYPQEIETAALKYNGISDAVCFATDDKITGKAACLQLIQSEGCKTTEAQIREHLLSLLDSYKIPKYIEFVDHIEKTANGKPNRRLQALNFSCNK